jgi:hypothetical protein
MALHAAIATSALRRALASQDAQIGIWKAGPDGSVRTLRIPVRPVVKEEKFWASGRFTPTTA